MGIRVQSGFHLAATGSGVLRIGLTRAPIEQKESIRWLDNMQQSTELLGDLGRCVHIGDRESDIWERFWTLPAKLVGYLARAHEVSPC